MLGQFFFAANKSIPIKLKTFDYFDTTMVEVISRKYALLTTQHRLFYAHQ
jgi:hypothetical protein